MHFCKKANNIYSRKAMKGCQNLTHIFTISSLWFHDTLHPCKSWRDPGDSGFMPHDWRTKVEIYWICSLASKWWLRVFSGFSPSLNDRVQSQAGVKSKSLCRLCCMLQTWATNTWASRETVNKPITAACRKGNPSILVDPGFIKIYTRFHLLLQHEARLTHHPVSPQERNSNTLSEQILGTTYV